MTGARALSAGERALAAGVFGDAIDYTAVRIVQRKWAFFQPRETVMAPRGCIHFHPRGHRYRADFATAPLADQGLFVHEMVHVWQHQRGVCLPLARHPWCRYEYAVKPGQPLHRYGIEQQAEIVRHAFLLRAGASVVGAPPLAQYATILPFTPLP
ncbi:vgr related protein [Sphingomonas oligophenolica]|uniref:Vgr related protein n=1 Tax=Sphingomonas oligophenolica TaxID=301154 RepID=A0A502CRW1_9SPHN|nr:vgr related protein [Sphingomonas oligophenolica]TPG15260.1 vgr related protein [Sphingomonas oligophenolica]